MKRTVGTPFRPQHLHHSSACTTQRDQYYNTDISPSHLRRTFAHRLFDLLHFVARCTFASQQRQHILAVARAAPQCISMTPTLLASKCCLVSRRKGSTTAPVAFEACCTKPLQKNLWTNTAGAPQCIIAAKNAKRDAVECEAVARLANSSIPADAATTLVLRLVHRVGGFHAVPTQTILTHASCR